MNEKNDKYLTKSQEELVNELVDVYMEAFENLSSDKELRKLLEKGGFSNKDFEWLVNHALTPEEERKRMSVQDRQHKLRVKRTIAQALATISLASYFQNAFSEEEWLDLLPPSMIYSMVYLTALRSGFEGSVYLTTAIDLGLKENLKITSEGLLGSKVSIELIPSSEELLKINTQLGIRINERLKNIIKKNQEENSNSSD